MGVIGKSRSSSRSNQTEAKLKVKVSFIVGCKSKASGMNVKLKVDIKGDMTRYLLMSVNQGIWNIKHDFI